MMLTVTVSGSAGNMSGDRTVHVGLCSSRSVSRVSRNQTINSHADTDSDSDTDGDIGLHVSRPSTPASATLVRV